KDIGGYLNHVYVVLDTDPILVPENGHLTFKLNYNCEPAGSDPDVPEYNGWDGSNVRISTDGDNWQVLNGAPAYEASSLYSFGVEHGEGANVPGWCGTSNGWVDADFDLSAYSGQKVQIRFAFASDPSTNTTSNGEYFGMMVDDIALGDYSNDGSSLAITPGNLVEGAGDHWNIVSPGCYSDKAIVCTENGSIGSNWYNYLESQIIFLPSEGELSLDMMLKGVFDAHSFWGCDISVKFEGIWSDWNNITNLTNDSQQIDYVFGAPGENWINTADAYDVFPIDLTSMGGKLIKLRVYLKTTDAATGEGLALDDIIISQTVYPSAAPENLLGELNQDFSVSLTWDANSEAGLIGYNVYRIVAGEYQLIEMSDTT
ncbi:MAG: immune inhibitor A, partial [Candidatus Cloacimonetes bacterium]|nr:immune inhibitor A [Candidatus Cloacimonadota bacterium]